MSDYQGLKQLGKRRVNWKDEKEVAELSGALERLQERVIQEREREWREYVKSRCHVDAAGEVVLTRRMVGELAEEALMTLRYLTRRGDREAARILLDRCFGMPVAPFEERVAVMTAAEAKQEMLALMGKTDLSETEIEGILVAVEAAPRPVREDEKP